ncbi:MAG: HAMP domain-containing protein [Chloroflexi bacterium]|nr:HAMP domain-containing protein [Chloroflexota bacterium]
MFRSLRSQLIISYLVIIMMTLCVVAFALLVILSRSPLQEEQVFQQLDAVRQANQALIQRTEDEQLFSVLDQIAEDNAGNNVRVLLLEGDSARDLFLEPARVAYDSGGTLQGEQLRVRLNIGFISGGQVQLNRRGRFTDENGDEWLFSTSTTGSLFADRSLNQVILIARPRRTGPLLEFLSYGLALPLMQAGCVGILVASAFAIIISSSVARPLRKTAYAANALAAGDYSVSAPESGPREVAEVGRAFNVMSNEIQKAQQTQRDFLANVSHELKTPLTSIQGFAQAILDGAAPDPTRPASIIYAEANRMKRLVHDLLDLARIESGNAPMRLEQMDMNALLKAIVDRFEIAARKKDISLNLVVQPVPQIMGDGDRLAQVFTNLIDNAIRHTPSHGMVTVSARPVNGGVQASVSDTGRGIPSEALERIFERFYQVDKSRKRAGRQGTGLGLTISKEIVEAHEGEIHVESGENQGTTFVVWLPASLDPVSQPAATTRRMSTPVQ